MKEFSILGFAEYLATRVVVMDHETTLAVKSAAVLVEKEAKASIGTYQAAAGPFAAWAELAEATKNDRAAQGYAENEPLLREGTLRDSIGHVAIGHEAVIGSNSDVAEYQELGTHNILPRSFLGGAAFRKSRDVAGLLGEASVKALVGAGVFTGRLPIP